MHNGTCMIRGRARQRMRDAEAETHASRAQYGDWSRLGLTIKLH